MQVDNSDDEEDMFVIDEKELNEKDFDDINVYMYMYTIYSMTWKQQAPLVYMVITIAAALVFVIAFVVALRRQPHRFQRIRRFLCCLKLYTLHFGGRRGGPICYRRLVR